MEMRLAEQHEEHSNEIGHRKFQMWSTEGGRSQTIDPVVGCRGVELLHGCVYVLYTQYRLCALQVLFPLLMDAELQFWAESR